MISDNINLLEKAYFKLCKVIKFHFIILLEDFSEHIIIIDLIIKFKYINFILNALINFYNK